MVDPLSAILQDFRLHGVSYGQCELHHPWGLIFEAEGTARLHLVIEGALWLKSGGVGWELLSTGDMVLLPRGPGHVLCDQPDTLPVPIHQLETRQVADRVFDIRAGGPGKKTVISYCSVGYDGPALQVLTSLMPSVMILRAGNGADESLRLLLDGMAAEVQQSRAGSATMLARYADLVVAKIIRAWAETAPASDAGWLAAVRDTNLGRALMALHGEPGFPWSVERLAAQAGMSRSSFFAKFTAVVGQTPARYLAAIRMNLATTMLRHQSSTIAEAATRLGYESEAAFSRAYKRVVGCPPSLAR